MLNLDHIRAGVREHHACQRRRDHGTEFEDHQAFERLRCLVGIFHLAEARC